MRDLFIEIFASIRRNKLRTILTGLSVSWGIFILIVLLGAGNGLINAFSSSSDMVSNSIVSIWGGRTSMPYNGIAKNRRIRINEQDAKAIEGRFSNNVVQAIPFQSQGGVNLSTLRHNYTVNIEGVYPLYQQIGNIRIVEGRFINQYDMDRERKSIVLNIDVAEELYGSAISSIGREVRMSGLLFKVVGVYQDDGNMGGHTCYIPFTSFTTIYSRGVYTDQITLQVTNLDNVAQSERFDKQLQKMMSERKSYHPDDPNGIFVWNRLLQTQTMNVAMKMLNMLLWVIGICTLLSGIVGVSNIMLITVKERQHEFGICKALGARPWSILRMVLLESVMITLIFGYFGLFLGVCATEIMNVIAEESKFEIMGITMQIFKNPTIDISIAIQALITLVIAGLIAGFVPAKRAVSIKPIEALRAE